MTLPADDLVMLSQTHARRTLSARHVRFSLLAPVGAWLGMGELRVLRALSRTITSPDGEQTECVELMCGYESYEPVRAGER